MITQPTPPNELDALQALFMAPLADAKTSVPAPASMPEPSKHITVPQPDANGEFRSPADGAKWMASLGIPQVPVMGKDPSIGGEGWPDKASTDPAQIDRWAKEFRGCNFGSRAKRELGGFYVFETDSLEPAQQYKAATGKEFQAHLKIQSSAVDRHHRWYLHSEESVAEMQNIGQREGLGFSLRSNNEMAVSPGSIHPCGAQYRVIQGEAPAPQPAEELRWLNSQRAKPGSKAAQIPEIISENRNNTLTSLAGTMRRRAASEAVILAALREMNQSQCHPPLEDEEVAAIATSIAKYPSAPEVPPPTDADAPAFNPTPKGSSPKSVNDQAKTSGSSPTNGIRREIQFIRGDKVAVRKVKWIWKKHLIAEGLNGFSGEAGSGKSTTAADIVARITRGDDFPDGAPNLLGVRDVLIICDEDGREDTIKPRLMVAGADMTHVWFLTITVHQGGTTEEASLRLDKDLPLIEEKCHEHPGIVLIIPDPVTEYLGDADPNSNKEVTPIYAKMLQFSKRTSAGWLLISHFNKDREANAVNRNSGAKVMVTKPRCNFIFSPDPKSTDGRMLMLGCKCNIAKPKAMAFYTDTKDLHAVDEKGDPIICEDITFTRWDGETDDKADDVLLRSMNPKDSAAAKVHDFLDVTLAEGAKLAKDCYREAEKLGIFEDALKTHSRGHCFKLEIHDKATGQSSWYWAQTKDELHDLRTRLAQDPEGVEEADADNAETTAQTFLDGIVGDATMPVTFIKEVAKARGMNWETIQNARKRYGYISATVDNKKCWRKPVSVVPVEVADEPKF